MDLRMIKHPTGKTSKTSKNIEIAVDSTLGIQRVKQTKRVKCLKLRWIASWASSGDYFHMIACDVLRLSWKCIDVQWFLVTKAGVDSTLDIQTAKTNKTNKTSKYGFLKKT